VINHRLALNQIFADDKFDTRFDLLEFAFITQFFGDIDNRSDKYRKKIR